MQRRVHYFPRRLPWRRALVGAGLVVLLLLTFVGGAAWFVNQGEEAPPEPAGAASPPATEKADTGASVPEKIIESARAVGEKLIPDWPESEPFSVLVIGVDTRQYDVGGRADTLIVVTIDPEKQAALLISIPRDMMALIAGYEDRRINELFAYGGPELVLKSAEYLLGMPIQYYLTIDFEGFRRMVDTLGGVKIDVKYDIEDYKFPNADDTGFEPFIIARGEHHMDGDTLLRYVRTRWDDPRGDFGRIERQQQALVALKSQLLTHQTFGKIHLLLGEFQGMVDTNFPISPQRALALGKLGLAIEPERIYSKVIDYEGNLVADVELESGAKVLRPNLPAVRSMMERSLLAIGQLEPVAGQEATLQQADVEP